MLNLLKTIKITNDGFTLVGSIIGLAVILGMAFGGLQISGITNKLNNKNRFENDYSDLVNKIQLILNDPIGCNVSFGDENIDLGNNGDNPQDFSPKISYPVGDTRGYSVAAEGMNVTDMDLTKLKLRIEGIIDPVKNEYLAYLTLEATTTKDIYGSKTKNFEFPLAITLNDALDKIESCQGDFATITGLVDPDVLGDASVERPAYTFNDEGLFDYYFSSRDVSENLMLDKTSDVFLLLHDFQPLLDKATIQMMALALKRVEWELHILIY